MDEPSSIPALNYCHPDGTPRTRLEMEQWLRSEVPKVHWLRIIANRIFQLPKQISWDMREIVLKHWLLDEMIRQRFITGDVLGINSNDSNNESELRQFTQKLVALIQSGQAVQPQHSEGIDMTSFTPPPPSMGPQPNGQPNMPSPMSMPPGPPMAPVMPQQYQQAPAPPMAGPSGYGPPPGPPMSAPPMNGPPMGPPSSPPPGVAAAPTAPRRGRPPKDPSAHATPTPTVPQAGPPGYTPVAPAQPQVTMSPSTPPGFTAVTMPAVVSMPSVAGTFAPLPAQVVQTPELSIKSDQKAELLKLEQKIDQLIELNKKQSTEVASLTRKVEMTSMVATILVRSIYQKAGSPDVAVLLAELGSPVPQ